MKPLLKTANLQTIVRLSTIFCTVFLFFVISAGAKTLEEYRDNLVHLEEDVIEILYPDEGKSASKIDEFEQEFLDEVNSLLPAKEKIEFQGTTIETDNQWFTDKISEYKNAPKNSSKREAILNEIYERLGAIRTKINELENPALSDRTKDEDKQKLAEILRREEYQKPAEKEESLFQKFYREFMEWLESIFPRPQIPQTSIGGFQGFSFVLQIILYALVLGVIGFLIYKFAPFFALKFRQREKIEKKDRVILGEKLTADDTSANLFSEAERLAREGNLRQAIRKGYIALLCELDDRKIIGLAQHKTNRDYLRDVHKRGELYENMNGLTQNFERHWYGFETAEQKDWEEFRQDYVKTVGSRV